MLTPAPATQGPGQVGYPGGPQAQKQAQSRCTFFSKLKDKLGELWDDMLGVRDVVKSDHIQQPSVVGCVV
jgi:hypothetical protein